MNQFSQFIQLIKKSWYVLIGIPVMAVVVTFFLVGHLPNQYVSHIRIATGLVERSDEFLKSENNVQESQINQQFGNIIQLITIRKVINRVSYQLIIHDITQSPYRKPSNLFMQLNSSSRQHLLQVCKEKYLNNEELSLWNNDEKGIQKVIASMGYDYESVLKNILVYRVGTSDFVDAEFTSDNAELSAFVVNNIAKEFLSYYGSIIKENQNKAVSFLDSLVREKAADMNNKMLALKNYKIRNRVLNLQEQAKNLYGQIADIETKREVAKKDIDAYGAASKGIDDKFDPQKRRYFESGLIDANQSILITKEQLQNANNEYIKSGFDPLLKKRLDSLQSILSWHITQSTDRYINNPLATKDNLVAQKLNLDVNKDLAKNSINSLNNEVSRLNKKVDQLVPYEASIQAFESDIDIASKEYIELLRKFNQTSMESSFSTKLRLVETGMPGDAKPSKKMLLVVLAGVVTFFICFVLLFILFYLDDTIKDTQQLANATGYPVLGTINNIDYSKLNWNNFWHNGALSKEEQALKNNLRSLRLEIEKELLPDKILGITNLSTGEEASFIANALTQAIAATNKKVLLIHTAYSQNIITADNVATQYIEDILKSTANPLMTNQAVTIIQSKNDATSLLEIATEEKINDTLRSWSHSFDVIIIDMASMENNNKCKEWLLFTNKVVGVFTLNTALSGSVKNNLNYLHQGKSTLLGFIATYSWKTKNAKINNEI